MALKREILVVEDNALNRELLGEILAQDYRVLEAENGQAALELLEKHKRTISLILLDVQMPLMDGYTFLDRIKQDPESALIPVIVMTQGNSEEDELAALAHGATDFVPKPYRPEIILHRMAGLIKLRETAAIVNELQYDRLTGLYCKEFFYQRVARQLLEDPDGQYCIVGANIENFKLVNDIFGTQEGDKVLREIADLAKRMVGEDGFCGRYGADRFLALLPLEQERRLLRNIGRVKGIRASSIAKRVVMRWGVYEIRDSSVPVEHMCDRALLAADSIKNRYEKRVAVYNDSLRRKLLREQNITSAMETALQEHQFQVYLQPRYDLRDNCIAGAEALVRWIHPEWGFLPPGEFIPLFEKNGFLPKLDQYIREEVCAMLRDWKDRGLPLLPVSVNVSRADAFQSNLTEAIPALTKQYGIEPELLRLELTESAYTEDPETIVRTVEGLRRKGFVVEMDDFGSGYSSFNMLSRIPMDILKLDMKLVQNEIAKPASQSFLGGIITMAHRAHMEVVAEGVETREQMNRLREEDCDYVQGYFCAKPMPAPQYEELLRSARLRQPSDSQASRRSAGQDCLLVVDEEAAYRKTVGQNFPNFRVVEADSGEDAVAFLHGPAGSGVSAVILSLSLPNQGAAAVMHTLRQEPGFWEVPVLVTIPSSQCAKDSPLALEADDFLCKKHPLFDLRRRVQRLVDVAALRRKQSVLLDAASHDQLTGLLNRRGFQDAMAAIRERDMPLAMCLFDLDDLKITNDSFGHDMGDRMIRAFADVLRKTTRAEDIKCRYGGDEFLVVFKHMADEKTAMKKGTAICDAFRDCAEPKGYSAACSVGVALCSAGEWPISKLIDYADQALYRAKRENKGGCCVWEMPECGTCAN